MEKTDLNATIAAKADSQSVLSRTLVIKPMEYHQGPATIYFSGVFGSLPDAANKEDVWCATFYDRSEAEAWIMSSRTFGQPVRGVRMALKTAEVKTDDATRVEGGTTPSSAG